MPARRPGKSKEYPVCSLEKAIGIITHKCGGVIRERHGKGLNKVLILPEAERELEIMISYGRRSPMNAKEQKYIGLGHFMVDERGNHINVICHFIEIQTTNRSTVGASNLGPNGEKNPGLDFLEYHRNDYLRTEAKYNTDAFGFQVDPFLNLCGSSEYVLEGHTHPDLGVFYSETDRISGAARAASSPVCIFVCDPIRKQMLGSIGKIFAEAEILVFSRKSDSQIQYSEDCICEESPVDTIITLASKCISSHAYTGNIRVLPFFGRKKLLKLRIIMPNDT